MTIKFEPRDCWIGLYWTVISDGYANGKKQYRFYLCILPTLPIIWHWIL